MTNLFGQIYPSDDNNFVSSGYVCETAQDVDGNQFAISDSEAQIQDSNEEELASIDLSKMISKPVYEWQTQNIILQANTSSILFGQSYGLSYEALHFLIPKELQETDGYEEYASVEFDLSWTVNYEEKDVHIDTKDMHDGNNRKSCWEDVQEILDTLEIPISVSVIESDIEDERLEVKFLSNALGFSFIIRNLRINPIYANEDFPDSPFIRKSVKVQDILDSIIEIKPYPTEDTTDDSIDDSNEEDGDIPELPDDLPDDPIIGDNPYEVDCNLYLYILDNIKAGILALGNPEDPIYEYPNYDSSDIYAIFERVQKNTNVNFAEDTTDIVFKLPLIIPKIVWPIKYPNGAMKGLMIVPSWPSSVSEERESLRYCFIRDFITEYDKTYVKYSALYPSDDSDAGWTTGYEDSSVSVWIKHNKEVRIGTKIDHELNEIQNKSKVRDFAKRRVISTNYDSAWIPGNTPTDQYFKFYEGIASIPKDEVWNGPEDDFFYRDTHEEDHEKIGIHEYLKHVTRTNGWNSFAEGLMIIASDDSDSDNTRNLIPSLVLRNPNPFPVQVKYMMFV